MRFETSSSEIAEQQVDAIIVPINENLELNGSGRAIDAAMDGSLAGALTATGFTGKVGSTAVIPTFGKIPAARLIAAGTGNSAELTIDRVRSVWGTAARTARDAGASNIACGPIPEVSGRSGHRAAIEGMLLALYRHQAYRTVDVRNSTIESVTFVGDEGEFDAVTSKGEYLADGIMLARDLVNTPGLDLFPERLGGRAWEMADQLGLECTIYDRKSLEEMGAGGIVGVGQGSSRDPRLIHLVYSPKGESLGTVGFVGKAITFDTGGVNLKPAEGMRDMKIDMAGGAAVIGAMRALAEMELPYTVHGVVAAAENMPSHNAYRPGDVLRTLSGKTIEITNTDAEGRVVLADALTFTARQGAELLIDLATLTGASVVAVGREAASLFGTDQELVNDLLRASDLAGERTWHMPLWESYRKDLDSDIADIKNSGNRDGGAIKAALFLKEFTHDVPWAHLDIAGPAWSTKESGYRVRGATGYGVHSLVTFLEERSR